MAFKKSNSSAGEEFAARKRPALGPNDQTQAQAQMWAKP